MNPHPVVEHFDVIEQLILRLLPRGEPLVMNHLSLQHPEEAFRHSVVPTITFAAHALRAAPRREPPTEGRARVLAATVTMHQRRDGPPAALLPLKECRLDEPGI